MSLLVLSACAGGVGGAENSPTSPSGSSASAVPRGPSSPAGGSAASIGPDYSPDPSPQVTDTAPTKAYRSARHVAELWGAYPWGPNDGLACPAPVESPGVGIDPAASGIAVVMGDSLIRESRDSLSAELGDVGFDVVFVCWGGKNLDWGMEQVEILRSLDLLPSCLVINLGTNDLKGTTAMGLSDAVPLATVSERLSQLLIAVHDVPDVFVVDIAADVSLAPGTMAEVNEAANVWRAQVEETGVGAWIPWSAQVEQGGMLGGDGVHDSATGQSARAHLIAEYVARDCHT